MLMGYKSYWQLNGFVLQSRSKHTGARKLFHLPKGIKLPVSLQLQFLEWFPEISSHCVFSDNPPLVLNAKRGLKSRGPSSWSNYFYDPGGSWSAFNETDIEIQEICQDTSFCWHMLLCAKAKISTRFSPKPDSHLSR